MIEAAAPDEPVEAKGVGADLFDAPTVFFLTYERQIRRWAALGERARETAGQFLETLAPDFEQALAQFGVTATAADTAGGLHHFLFALQDTPTAADSTPAIALSFGWPRRSLKMMPGYAPFVAVRVGPGPVGERARDIFLGGDAGRVRLIRKEQKYNRAKEWPVYAEVLGKEHWWADLDDYRRLAVIQLSRFADLFVGHIRRTVVTLPKTEL